MAKTQRHRQRKNKRGGLFGWGESNNNYNNGYNNGYGNNSNSGSWLGNLWGSNNNSGNTSSWFGRKNTQQQPQSYQGMPQDQGYFGGRYKNKRTKRTKKSSRRTRRHR
jgi:hypothetical protein